MFIYIRRLYIANIEYYYLQMQIFYEKRFSRHQEVEKAIGSRH